MREGRSPPISGGSALSGSASLVSMRRVAWRLGLSRALHLEEPGPLDGPERRQNAEAAEVLEWLSRHALWPEGRERSHSVLSL